MQSSVLLEGNLIGNRRSFTLCRLCGLALCGSWGFALFFGLLLCRSLGFFFRRSSRLALFWFCSFRFFCLRFTFGLCCFTLGCCLRFTFGFRFGFTLGCCLCGCFAFGFCLSLALGCCLGGRFTFCLCSCFALGFCLGFTFGCCFCGCFALGFRLGFTFGCCLCRCFALGFCFRFALSCCLRRCFTLYIGFRNHMQIARCCYTGTILENHCHCQQNRYDTFPFSRLFHVISSSLIY